MIRSLFAIIVATLIGLTVARFIEGALLANIGLEIVDVKGPPSPDHKKILLFSWGCAAFVASLMALSLGRRWAPLGWLAGGTVTFSALITMIAAPFGLFMWPAAFLVTAIGPFIAIKILRAQYDVTGSMANGGKAADGEDLFS